MSEERTEQATPKRQQKARNEGNVAKSQDLNNALVLSVAFALFYVFSGSILKNLKFALQQTFTHLHPSEISSANAIGMLSFYNGILLKILVPFFSLLFIAVLFIIGIQLKGLFTLHPLKPKLDKYSPAKLMKSLISTFNIFKPKNFVELIKSFIKLIIISMFAWGVIKQRKVEILSLFGANVETFFIKLGMILSEIIINICIALLILGILDWIFQKHEFEKSLKMTKQEVKDERKNAEGDPKIKSKIRSIQMQMAASRMMAKVPEADVIVANPTHYAVALKYDSSKAPAPMVVAKGVDLIAFKIREVAENNGIIVVENPPLARTLYKLVPIDAIIPAELFAAVAEVLAFVYKKKTGRA